MCGWSDVWKILAGHTFCGEDCLKVGSGLRRGGAA